MGEVYRARDPRLGRDVAIKVLSGAAPVGADALARFEQEARAAAALSHPNIVTVLDVGSHEGVPFVVFELLDGETLRERLGRGRLPTRKAVEYGVQLCEGLAAAHGKGIVHRDLKPDNVFLTRDGHAKIFDFGVAKLTRPMPDSDASTRHETERGQLVGTFAYMSPEQVKGEPIDSRADLFAFGATLYEMLAGGPAFLRRTSAETLSAILNDDPSATPRSGDRSVPPALETVLRKCLEKEPHERFQSARDLSFALTAVLNSLSVPDLSVASPVARLGVKPVWLLVAAAVLVGAIGVWIYTRDTRGKEKTGPLTAVPFTSFPGQEVAPTFSPDGTQIAFAWSPEGPQDLFDLYVKVVGSEIPLRLTTHPADFISPAWSPDGHHIAFARMSSQGSGIYLISPLGGPERKLADAEFEYFLETIINWSPDGKVLAFYDKGPSAQYGISLLDLATLQKTWRAAPSADCMTSWVPAFSPDGTSLAFACMVTYGVNDLFVSPAGGGTPRRVARVQGDFTGMTWAPDGTGLIFASDGDLWRVAAAGREPEKLLAGRDASMPAAARNGHRLAYTTQTLYNVNIWQLPLAGTAHSAGTATKVISSSRTAERPTFSPDGRRLAFEASRTGSNEIWTSDADGSNAIPLTNFRGPWTGSPAWSPDGQFIAFDSRPEGHANIYVMRSDGGPVRRVVTGVEDSSEPEWSVDGNWLYFTGTKGGATQIYRVPREGGTSQQLTTRGGTHPQVSRADRTRIYYSQRGKVCTMSVSGSDERCPSEFPRLSQELSDAWVIDEHGIYYIDAGAGGPGVKFFDFSSGHTIRVADLPGRPHPYASDPALAPDGGRLLYAQLDALASDIMLIDTLR
jgi:Tol biopolymer transport system component